MSEHKETLGEDARTLEADLGLFLSQFGGQEVRVQIMRTEPTYFKGHKTRGVLETIDDFSNFDEQMIRERFGGGKYQLRVFKRNNKGKMAFHTSSMVEIAGNPIIPDDGSEPQNGNGHGNGRVDAAGAALAGRALDVLHQHVRDVREEAKESKPGIDHALIRAMQEPVLEQLRGAQRQVEHLQNALAAKEERLFDTIAKPPPPSTDGFTHRILEKMVDGESARVDTLRTTHEAELRQLRGNHQAELDRERDRLKEDARARERQHEREVDMIKQANQMSIDAMKTSYETRIDGLKSEVSRLQGDLSAAKTEIADLRARKDKSLVDQAKEIASVRDALKDIAGDGEESDEGKSVIERVANRVFENPEAIGQIFGGVRGAIAPGPSPEQIAHQQQLELQAMHAHQVQQAQAQMRRRRRRPRPAAAAPEPQTTPPVDDGLPDVSAAEVKQAIAFMENAVVAGTDPAVFALSARAFVPSELIRFIEKVGIDAFLDNVGLDDGSVLRTQRGRNFSRSAFEVLLRG